MYCWDRQLQGVCELERPAFLYAHARTAFADCPSVSDDLTFGCLTECENFYGDTRY